MYERDDRLGGLLRYGIPEFKLEKRVVERRLSQMRVEGTHFVTEVEVGVDLAVSDLRERFDAVVLATGALLARDNPDVQGRGLDGVHLAMEHLVASNHECEGDGATPISARASTSSSSVAATPAPTAWAPRTARRAVGDPVGLPPGAAGGAGRDIGTVAAWPMVLRTSPAHAEGGVRRYEVAVQRFLGDDSGTSGRWCSRRSASPATNTADA